MQYFSRLHLFAVNVSLLLLVITAPRSSGEDDIAWIDVLKGAYESHLQDIASGRMVFSTHFEHFGSGEYRDVKGEIEWAESYYYFEGEITRFNPGFAGGELRVENTRTLVLDGTVISWRTKSVPLNRIVVVFVPETQMRNVGLDALSPDPLVMLASLEANSDSFEKAWFEYPLSPIVVDSALGPVSRNVNVDGATVTVTAAYNSGWHQELAFDMDHGGLCHSLRTVRNQSGESKQEDTTWDWVQNDEGVWYPKTCRVVGTQGVFSEEYAKYECHISSLEPLKDRRYTKLRSETEFGEIPHGAVYTFLRRDNVIVSEVVSRGDVDLVSESALRELARSLSESGFGRSK
jgi:hypothetical protein